MKGWGKIQDRAKHRVQIQSENRRVTSSNQLTRRRPPFPIPHVPVKLPNNYSQEVGAVVVGRFLVLPGYKINSRHQATEIDCIVRVQHNERLPLVTHTHTHMHTNMHTLLDSLREILLKKTPAHSAPQKIFELRHTYIMHRSG